MTNHLGNYLHILRTAQNLSTRQLAQRIEISASMIWRIEQGERGASLATLWKFTDALQGDFNRALYWACVDAEIPDAAIASLLNNTNA